MNNDIFVAAAKKLGIVITEKMLKDFEIYTNLLLSFNQKVNLTAITQPEEIYIKHFLDSIVLLSVKEIPQNASIVDVGTGAGFPGVPLKILRPDINLLLLDSLNKRLIFLKELSDALCQDNTILHSRAEAAAEDKNFREKYDIALSRALGSMPVLCEYCLPYVKVGGFFAAYKGAAIEEELETAKNAIGLVGGELEGVSKFLLPDNISRSIVIIKKISHTLPKYPRKAIKISKSPLS